MKRAAGIIAAIVLISAAGAAEAGSGFVKALEARPLPPVKAPPIRVVVLPNGIRCFLLEDHTLPMLQMSAIFRTGGIYEPADKLGLAQVTGMLMRSGGAGDRSPEQFDAAVDDLGAEIYSDIDHEMGRAALRVLSDDFERGAGLFFDMLFAPRLDPARFKVARLKIEEALRREQDDPRALATRDFRQLVYGEASPWARRPTKKTLRGITTDDVRAFQRRYYTTNNMLLSVSGDFEAAKLIEALKKLTAAAPGAKPEFPAVAPIELEFKPAVKDVVRPMTQSYIRMGHLGIKRHNPDKFALLLLSDILGASSFKSRLMEDIRTRRGMAYSIWSDMQVGTDYGLFIVASDTKSKQAAEVVDLIRDHIERLAKEGAVTSEELSFAKQATLSRLVFEFDSAAKAVGQRATFFFYGYPDDYWRVFRDRIAAVEKPDIKDVAARYLHPDGLKIVVVGPKSEKR